VNTRQKDAQLNEYNETPNTKLEAAGSLVEAAG